MAPVTCWRYQPVSKGFVSLVGAGPGDPGLLTVKGMQRLQSAEVVLYDRLLDPALLDYVPASAERVYVGKQAARHALSQSEINALLVARGLAGKRVVRLKGGDPFVFGRGGEELEALHQAGVAFEVVPGVTSSIAAAAYAGIPITHRGHASSFTVVTGHEDPTKPDSSLQWEHLAPGTGTLVFLMGVENLEGIVARLLQHGRAPETPVALVRRGTWADQEVVTGTLGDIAKQMADRDFPSPAVIVVGEVVRLRDALRWWDARPLSGKRVVVTRAREQASDLAAQLSALGAEVIEAPAIHIAEPASYEALDAAIAGLAAYGWVVFTSANGVAGLFGRLQALGGDARRLGGVRVAAVGPGTTAALNARGIKPDYVPQRALTAEVAEGLIAQGVSGQRILLPRTDIVGEDLAGKLAAAGAVVDQVVAYCTLSPAALEPEVEALLRSGEVDIITFASASTVRNLCALLGHDAASVIGRSTVATIGPITSQAAKELGVRVDAEATDHTVPGLVEAVLQHAAGQAPTASRS